PYLRPRHLSPGAQPADRAGLRRGRRQRDTAPPRVIKGRRIQIAHDPIDFEEEQEEMRTAITGDTRRIACFVAGMVLLVTSACAPSQAPAAGGAFVRQAAQPASAGGGSFEFNGEQAPVQAGDATGASDKTLVIGFGA